MMIQERILSTILNELDLKTPHDRNEIQKSIFFLQEAPYNINLGFHYHFWINGPYSQSLNEEYNTIKNNKPLMNNDHLIPDISDKIYQFKKWIHNSSNSIELNRIEALEFLTTITFLYKYSLRYIDDTSKRIDKIKEKYEKPKYLKTFDNAIRILKSNGNLN